MIRDLDEFEEEHLEFLTQTVCSSCEGCGRVLDEEWSEYYDWCDANGYEVDKALRVDEAPESEQQAFWLNKGYGGDPRTWPEQDSMCSRCNGSGLIRGSVTIHDIKELLDKHQTDSFSV